jgi:hypothetical protein
MIFRCTSCQHEMQPGLPPAPAMPTACEKCGASVSAIHDTEPPPAPEPDATMPDDAEPAATKGPRPKLLISTIIYGLARELGAEAATAELHRQIEELAGPFSGERDHDEYLPVAYTIARAMRVFDVGLYVDAGGTQIGKCRSRAMAHAMKHTEFPVWLSVDEDVECTLPTLVALYEAVDHGAPAIAIAPCFVRQRPLVNVAFPKVVVERTLVGSGAKLRTALYGGFGMVALSQQALTRIAAESEWFKDDDGETKPAAFAEIFRDSDEPVAGGAAPAAWFGEDLSFFLRVPPSVRVEALLTGHTRHAGETLALERVDLGHYETFQPPEEWLAGRPRGDVTERKVMKDEPQQTVVDGGA